MNGLMKENKIRTLIGSAISQSADLTEGRDEQVIASFERVNALLDVSINERNQIVMLLSAAVQQMRKVERLVLDGMRMDKWITRREEALLVHLRLICAQLIGLLTSELDENRLAPATVRHR
jgi:hypothetical protein